MLAVRLYAGRHQADGLQKDIHCPFSGTRALPEWPTRTSVLSIHAVNLNTNTRSRQRNGDRAPGWRCRSRSPKCTQKGGIKRSGEEKSGRGGLRRNMTNAERISRKYFRICSWNCANANKRGAVLERLAYHFDVLCLQETRTRPAKPLELKSETRIHASVLKIQTNKRFKKRRKKEKKAACLLWHRHTLHIFGEIPYCQAIKRH